MRWSTNKLTKRVWHLIWNCLSWHGDCRSSECLYAGFQTGGWELNSRTQCAWKSSSSTTSQLTLQGIKSIKVPGGQLQFYKWNWQHRRCQNCLWIVLTKRRSVRDNICPKIRSLPFYSETKTLTFQQKPSPLPGLVCFLATRVICILTNKFHSLPLSQGWPAPSRFYVSTFLSRTILQSYLIL